MAEANLKQKAIKGGFWVFLARIVSRVFSFLRLIVLARLLVPEDFGLMGIALLSLATLETFSETGFSQALIQKKKDIRGYLNVAWTVLILRGLVLFLLLYLIAPYAAVFFRAPLAKPIIQIIGLSILIQAFTNIGIVYFQRNLEFNKQFLYELSGGLADFLVAISAALILKNVWALVYGFLAGSMVRLIVSYLIHPYRPKIDLNLVKAKELFDFGKWILGSSILIFLVTQGDDIFVGKLLGVAALGFYQMAYKISNLPATEITHVISQVTFPAYSKLQDDLPKLRRAYLKVLQVTTLLSFPIAGLIFVLAFPFTKIFLGEKWLPMVPAMQVLAFFGVIRSIMATSGNLFQGTGRPKLTYKASWIELFCLLLIIYPLTNRLGIMGTALAVTLPSILVLVYVITHTLKIIECRKADFLKLLLYPIIGTILMGGILLCFQPMFKGGWPSLILSISLGICIYLSFSIMVDRKSKDYKLF